MKRMLTMLLLAGPLAAGAATTITVTNLADFNFGSLYNAINVANTSSPPVRIIFNYTGTPPYRIRYTNSFLPYLTNQVSIDGASQPGYTGQPVVWLDGSGVTNFDYIGILLQGGNSTLRALRVSGFGGPGIQVEGAKGNNQIVGCWIYSNDEGVVVYNSGNVIGGLSPSNRNVLSGNVRDGVLLQGTAANSNSILGNYIGLNLTNPAVRMPNAQYGVYLFDASYSVIQGVSTGRQVISGNLQQGIHVFGTQAVGNVIAGNFVGTDTTGESALSNGTTGVTIWYGRGNRIGGTNAADGNVISGNGLNGIELQYHAASNNVIQGNTIGMSASGVATVRNFSAGISVGDALGTLIGGEAPGAGNVIGGNRNQGISLTGSSGQHRVQGNFVGINQAGTLCGNGWSGIYVVDAPGTLIGGSNAAARNVVVGNGTNGQFNLSDGIFLNASNVTVQGNYIGIGTNNARLPNRQRGVGALAAYGCLIGGTNVGDRNVISGNNAHGIMMEGSRYMTVQGNYIGVNIAGSAVVTNVQYGIVVSGSTNCTIGGTVPGAGNVIAGNPTAQIVLDTGSQSNLVAGNYLGVMADGVSILTNDGFWGVFVSAAPNNTIGGASEYARNFFGHAQQYGVDLLGATGTVIQGNYIGLNAGGARVVSNALTGIFLDNSSATTIGGTNAGEGNVMAFWSQGGVRVLTGTNNAVLGNAIYSNGTSVLGIDLQPTGAQANDAVPDADTGPNNYQNYPVITNAVTLSGSTYVQGYLASAPSTAYRVEFFAADVNFREGRLFLGGTNVTTAADGTSTFAAVLNGFASTSRWMTSTATDPQDNTSEFSAPFKPAPATDTDGDLMPDFWESQYGLNPAVSNGAAADADGDGMSDYSECLAATLPNSSASLLEIASLAPGTTTVVSVPTSPFRTYNLEQSTNLADGASWRVAVTGAPGTGLTRALADLAPATQSAYRVRAIVP